MPGIRIIAVSLIVLGIIALAYEGITYTTREKVLEIGPITATKEKKETIPLSPVVGVLALVGGVALLVFGGRGRPDATKPEQPRRGGGLPAGAESATSQLRSLRACLCGVLARTGLFGQVRTSRGRAFRAPRR